jgi:hypothetical protein
LTRYTPLIPAPDKVFEILPPLEAASACRSFKEVVRLRARSALAQDGHQLPDWMMAGLVSQVWPLEQEIVMTEFMPAMASRDTSRWPFFLLMIAVTLATAF